MKCPKCGGNGFVPTNVFGVNGAIKCDFCDGTGVFITNAVEQTNEEWFCSLTTEEKARFIADNDGTIQIGDEVDYQNTMTKWLEWLKEKHE